MHFNGYITIALLNKCSLKSIWNVELTNSASELSGFTFTSALTMNSNFQYRTRRLRAVLKFLVHC